MAAGTGRDGSKDGSAEEGCDFSLFGLTDATRMGGTCFTHSGVAGIYQRGAEQARGQTPGLFLGGEESAVGEKKFRKEIAASREFLFRGKVKLAPEIALKSYWSFLG